MTPMKRDCTKEGGRFAKAKKIEEKEENKERKSYTWMKKNLKLAQQNGSRQKRGTELRGV